MKKYIYYFIFFFLFFFLFFLSGCRALIPAFVVLGIGGPSPEDLLKTDLLNEQCQKDFQRDCLLFRKIGEMAQQGEYLYVAVEDAIYRISLRTGKRTHIVPLETSWRPVEIPPSGLAIHKNVLYTSLGVKEEIFKIPLDTRESQLIYTGEDFLLSQKKDDFEPASLFIHEGKPYFAELYSGQFFMLDEDNKINLVAGSGIMNIKDGIGKDAQFSIPYRVAKTGNSLWMLDSLNKKKHLRRLNLETMEVKTYPINKPHLRFFMIAANEEYVFLSTLQTIYRYNLKNNKLVYVSGDPNFNYGQIQNGYKQEVKYYLIRVMTVHKGFLYLGSQVATNGWTIRRMNLETLEVTTL